MLTVILFLAAIFAVLGKESKLLNLCRPKLEPVGCFSDHPYASQRALPEQLLNERDPRSPAFKGRIVDWKNFEVYLAEFICRCAAAASAKGYSVIGIQFYNECWSGPEGDSTYGKYGTSVKCVDHEFKKFTNGSYCNPGTGTESSNFVYRVAPTTCNTQYEPVGCYRDSLVEPRPFPNYLHNERDYSIPNWNGILIDWRNWDTYAPKMICRCAEAARANGHNLFAIQFWGECWSGRNTDTTYQRDGPSTHCRAENFAECHCNSYHCVGMEKTNFVYKLIAEPKA